MITTELKARFMRHVDRGINCWLWKASLDTRGYGQMAISKKNKRAHRLSYELFRGSIPKGMVVCHSCDAPRCVNPLHLWLGTLKENSRDMVRKGRCKNPAGENHRLAKLTAYQVAEIRRLHEAGLYTQTSLARQFGVCNSNVSQILNGRIWRTT